MHVETILQAKGSLVYTLPETASLADAVSLLNTHNIGALVVTSAAMKLPGYCRSAISFANSARRRRFQWCNRLARS